MHDETDRRAIQDEVLGAVPASRRKFLTRLLVGAAFSVPLLTSFSLSASSAEAAGPKKLAKKLPFFAPNQTLPGFFAPNQMLSHFFGPNQALPPFLDPDQSFAPYLGPNQTLPIFGPNQTLPPFLFGPNQTYPFGANQTFPR